MNRSLALLTTFTVVAWSGAPQSDVNLDAARILQNQSAADADGQSTLLPGFYAGSWNDGYHTQWLALYVNREREAVTYVAAEVSRVCGLTLWGDSVRFTTGALPYWQTGDRFTFAFRGVRTSTGINGAFVMNGAPYDGKVFSTKFRFYPSAPAAPSGHPSLGGLYGLVRMHQETGDLLGDELLLVNTTRGLVAFYTDYEGVPVGPYPSDAITVHHDTITVGVPLGDPGHSTPITFIIRHGTSRGDTDEKTPDNISDPRYVAKRASVAEVFALSKAAQCKVEEQPRNKG